MRVWRLCAFAFAMTFLVTAAFAEDSGPQTTGSIGNAAAATPCPGSAGASGDVLGVSRIVEIDTAGGPGFGSQQFKAYDFLQPGEVVLTFDDGPWPGNTPAVLNALAAQCTKALFFPIGEHALWHPQILKQVAAAGHTIGSHTWSHSDLAKLPAAQAEEDIEKGFSAVRAALGEPESPFFRFPELRYSSELVSYLGTRNISTFSADFDSQDFKIHKPEAVIASVMTKLKKNGKGIVLMHDFQHGTALALPELLTQLKANGYRIVQVRAKTPVTTLAQFDEQVGKRFGGASGDGRPLSSIVRTIDSATFNDRFSAVR